MAATATAERLILEDVLPAHVVAALKEGKKCARLATLHIPSKHIGSHRIESNRIESNRTLPRAPAGRRSGAVPTECDQ